MKMMRGRKHNVGKVRGKVVRIEDEGERGGRRGGKKRKKREEEGGRGKRKKKEEE